MARRRILWQLYPSYLIITIVAVVAVTWIAANSFRTFYFNQAVDDLTARTSFVQPLVADHLTPPDTSTLRSICRAVGLSTHTRIGVIALDGQVLADSREDAIGENARGLTDFADALAGNIGVAVRLDLASGANHLAVSAPIRYHDAIVGVVRVSYPAAKIDEALQDFRITIGISVVVVALLTALVSLFIARRISRPLEVIKRGAERYAAGDFDFRLGIPDSAEIGDLATAINHMAAELNERIREAVERRNEQEAILASMTEGILVVDMSERLLNVNQAAAALFDINASTARGMLLQQAVRHPALQMIISNMLSTLQPASGDIVLYSGTERTLQIQGSILRGEREEATGALIVLHDTTRIHQLENVRRDFVANVSHELKTPVTSIKGYVETLLDGPSSPADTDRFLRIIMRQADRLNAIIDDLLSLSRIEQGVERADIVLEVRPLEGVLHNSLLGVVKAAEAKGISVQVHCDSSILARVNAPLLEQAVVNLIDNAVKYSDNGAVVTVAVAQSPSETTITVTDTGRGIAPEHLPRIFERFFRVDKSRSREVGGTGLGLAIVKHIVLAHSGTVSVTSQLDKGSSFRIHLPRSTSAAPASPSATR